MALAMEYGLEQNTCFDVNLTDEKLNALSV